MANTLKQYREQMSTLMEDPDGFGRTETVASGTATTVVVTALAVGSLASSKFQNKWLYRPDAANAADRTRMCSAYTASSGTLTHAGTNYIVNPASTENVEVLEYEPSRMNAAVNRALGRLRFRDIEIIPTTGADRYWMGQLSWISEPDDVDAVRYVPNPVLSRNRFFGKWNIQTPGTAAITAVPDSWTAYGATATYQRITTNQYRTGQYAVQIVAPGGNVAGLQQSVGLLNDGVTGDNLQSKIVTAVGVAQQSVASSWRAWYSDDGGTTKQFTAFSTNTTYPTELSAQFTVSATASNPTVGIEVVAGQTVQGSQCYMVLNAISDSVRKNAWEGQTVEIQKAWDQTAGPGALVMLTPAVSYGIGGQLEVHSKRSYPSLTLDTDTADAPLVDIAADALFLLYRGLASTAGQDNTRYSTLADYWNRRASVLRAGHFYTQFGEYGAQWPPKLLTAFPVRV